MAHDRSLRQHALRVVADPWIASLRRDQAWQARWMAGGAEEREEWTRLTRIAGAA